MDDDDTAHEIAAEAFTRLLARWSSLDNPQSYLYMIATNLVRDHWRRAGRERRALRAVSAASHGDPVHHPSQDVDVRALIQSLPDRLRQPFLLHYYAGFGVREVAAMLGSTGGHGQGRPASGPVPAPGGAGGIAVPEPRDELDTWLGGPVPPLLPPPARSERVSRQARRLRTRRVVLAAASALAGRRDRRRRGPAGWWSPPQGRGQANGTTALSAAPAPPQHPATGVAGSARPGLGRAACPGGGHRSPAAVGHVRRRRHRLGDGPVAARRAMRPAYRARLHRAAGAPTPAAPAGAPSTRRPPTARTAPPG